MASSSFLDRISNHRARSPVLPLHNASSRSPSEYQMNELSPRPDDASSAPSDDLPTAWIDEQDALGFSPRRSPPPAISWHGKTSPPASPSMKKPWAMFSGPPPPISASVVMSRNNRRRSQKASTTTKSLSNGGNALQGPMQGFVPLVGSVFFDPRPEPGHPRPDSRWRGLQRQEKALEQEVQKLLDAQAAALSAGSGGGVNDALSNDLDIDVLSDGSSTPTGTLYSTKSAKSAKSQMRGSLYVPTRATADGNVIPVRQPTKERPLGLRASRAGLQRSIMAMARLKEEESAYLDAALAQRTEALEYLNHLSSRKADIDTELKDLDQGAEEPLGQELRELTEKHSILDREIQRLEDQLAAMRNRRRWLEEKMDSIRNKREAGLSGYRGALKEVDAEVAALVQRPPVQPLDPEILCLAESSGGAEFLQLNPARRTLEMARSWWESEAAALQNRKTRIDADRQALEEGGVVWELVMQLVSDFESSLRRVMKSSSSLSLSSPSSSASASTSSTKGKERMPSQEETIRNQLPQMKNVMGELERHMSLAQDQCWNLLICAIGAEAEAFREAYNVLEAFVGPSGDDAHSGGGGVSPPGDAEAEETDNEVPQDLLGPPAGDGLDERDLDVSSQGGNVPLQRAESDSENEVPLEFLSEHVSP